MASNASNSSINPDLQEVHDTLVATVSDLSDALGDAPNTDTVKRLLTEIDEVNHRVTLVGSLLFTQQTKAITAAAAKVDAATGDLQSAIKDIDDLTDFLKTITAFLTLVDKVVDTAKLVLPAV